MEKIVPLFSIASLYHNLYHRFNIRYLAGDPALVNCNLLGLSCLLFSKDTSQKALGIPISAPLATSKLRAQHPKLTSPNRTPATMS